MVRAVRAIETPAWLVPPERSPRERVTGSRGMTPLGGPLKKTPWASDATVGFAGRVVDELGRPLAGVVVMATRGWSGPITRTGDDGGFTLPVLPPGRYVLFAVRSAPLATSRPIVVETGYFPARLRLVVAESAALL